MDLTTTANLIEEGHLRWEALFAASRDGMVLLDDGGRVVEANPATARLLGYNQAELLRIHFWDFLPSASQTLARAGWPQFLQGGAHTGEWVGRRRDGGDLSVEYWVLPRFRPGRHLVVFHDVTARQQAEARSHYLGQLLLGVQDAVIATDDQQRITAWNQGAEVLYGWRAEEVLGRPVAEVLQTEFEGSDRAEALEHVLETGAYQAEVVQRRKDGTPFPVEGVVRALRDAEGQVTGLVAVNRDITARIRTQERLAYHAYLLDHVHDCVIASDVQGHITAWNHAAEELYGWTAGEVLGRLLRDVVGAAYTEEERSQIRAEVTRRGYFHIQARHLRRDGTPLYVEGLMVGLTEADEQQTGYLYTYHDVTERRAAEDQARRAAERTSVLLRVAGTLNAQLDLARVVDTVCAETTRAMSAPVVMVWLYDEAHDVFEYTGGCGMPPDFIPVLRPVSRAYVERFLQPAGPLHVVTDLANLAEAPNYPVLAQLGFRTNVLVSLSREGQHIGLLCLATLREPRVFSTDELDLLQGLADQAALAIQKARLFETIDEHRERLRGLSARLVEAQETERRHLARELHDEVGQQLTGLQVALEMAARNPAQAPTHLLRARELTRQLIDEVHDLSLALRPTMLDDLGLLPALLWHFERYTEQTGLPVRFEQQGAARRLPAPVETAVYRIIQEALTNAARHAQPQAVTVRLWVEPGRLGMLVEDDGRGFDVAAALGAHVSSGLSGMLERAAALGATLALESTPGGGTQVTLDLPLARPAPAAPP